MNNNKFKKAVVTALTGTMLVGIMTVNTNATPFYFENNTLPQIESLIANYERRNNEAINRINRIRTAEFEGGPLWTEATRERAIEPITIRMGTYVLHLTRLREIREEMLGGVEVRNTDRTINIAPSSGTMQVIWFDEPTLLTSAELIDLTKNAPTLLETASNINLNRRLTEIELNAWIEEYKELGGINDFELEIIRLINEERARHGLRTLAISQELSMAARFHSQSMMNNGYSSHWSNITGSPRNRADMFGHINNSISTFGVGEDIHFGGGRIASFSSFVSAAVGPFNSWMNSTGHRRQILDSDALTIGIGSFNDGNSRFEATVNSRQLNIGSVTTLKVGY
ncbi:MAG: CAP domain-containing protein [Defluviitaleaceae bacterium]|nr:CAP domain-containing protein [Defluviitaleaceae bacterium]